MNPGERFAGRFLIERFAGEGGMGRVYRAIDEHTGEAAALKVLRQGASEAAFEARFAREARVLAGLHHAAIVRYVAHGRAETGARWLAMEWLDGEDLGARLERGALAVDDAITLVRRVASALAEAHAAGVVHRDVKPANVFLEGGALERAKVLDFGLARPGGAPVHGGGGTTIVGAVVGTPGYMAPEQARGEEAIDARADVFALGAVLFECLAGQPAFRGDHPMALLAKILLDEAPRLAELDPTTPPALDALVARLLAKDPAGRPADGAAVVAELDRLDLQPARAAPLGLGLGRGERRLLCVVLAAPPALGEASALLAQLRAVVAAHEGRLEELADGSLAVALTGAGAATDLAARAARCALALRALLPGAPTALATGRGEIAGRRPMGEAIDRAAALIARAIAAADPEAIRVDDVTAGLLPARFELGGDAGGLTLRAERELAAEARTLLGRATPFVGRDRELAVLEGALASVIDDQTARVVLVTAPVGSGKSRLASELARRIETRGEAIAVWHGRGDPMSAGSPFGMIAPAIRRAAGIQDGEPLPLRRKKLHARLGRHLAAKDLDRVAAFLGELVGAPAGPDEGAALELAAARRDPVLLGDQMRRAFEDLLEAETTAAPLVLVLEDLHWGDLPSVRFVDAALRHLRDRPFFVLALARPEVHDVFPDLWAGRALEEIRLGGLLRKSSERLARQVLGAAASEAVIARIVDRAAGNAFFLEELIRAAAAGGGAEAPATVLAMVEARIGALDPEARRALRAASVLGEVFWQGAIAALLGGGRRAAELAVLEGTLVELAAREVISPREGARFPGEREYAFRHGLVRDAAYATLTEADRALGHGLAGAWLEGAGEVEAATLAEHFARGHEPSRARAWYLLAAEQALGGDDFVAAIALAARAAEAGAAGEELGALRWIQAEAHGWRGEMDEAAARGGEALAALPEGSPRWCSAAGEVANALTALARREPLAALLGRIRALGSEAHHVGAQARVATNLFQAGLRAEAEALLAGIGARVEALDPAVAGWLHHARSWSEWYADDAAASLREEARAVAAFERAGDLRNACYARMGLGVAYREIGATTEAEAELGAALTTSERMSLSRIRAVVLQNLGPVAARRGALAEARAFEEEAVRAFAAAGDRRMLAGSRLYLAEILFEAGELDAALAEAELAMADPGGSDEITARAHCARSVIELARGDAAAALASAAQGMRLLEASGRMEEGEAWLRLAHAEALHASGHEGEARAALVTARERLLARAAKIAEPAWRASFLARPESARTLALAESARSLPPPAPYVVLE